jgi:hypothetical protein
MVILAGNQQGLAYMGHRSADQSHLTVYLFGFSFTAFDNNKLLS